MRKVAKLVSIALIIIVVLVLALSSVAFASNANDYQLGPAPSAGDGESEGPEWAEGVIPNGLMGSGSGPMGPLGDCNHDGSCQV